MLPPVEMERAVRLAVSEPHPGIAEWL